MRTIIAAPEDSALKETSSVERALSWLVRGKDPRASHAMLIPATLWLLCFLLLPVASLLAMSLATRGPYSSVIWTFTWANFARALDHKYLVIVLRTVGYALSTTGLCLILGFPMAYFLSFYAGKRRETLMILLMIPFWTSCLVAIYSWIIILGRAGLLNNTLLWLGVIKTPLLILNTPFSVILGLVYFYLPFMILPLFSSLEKIPRTYIEASYDLGAGTIETFVKVTLPLALPGVFAGCILTFVPCIGDFLTAEFLGGPKTYLIGNLVQNQFLMAQDWPFGAAVTSVLLLSLISGVYLYQRLESQELERA
ncbi:MAG: ABC transporter permease [Elusimicrobia bacterium]|nr:ABC transporter permease [Elusimicrobiota bacterium]